MTCLEKYKYLKKQAEDYYNQHKDSITKEIEERECNIILENMPKLQNISVWCRDGNVCPIATHCNQLSCTYKQHKHDVVSGCAKCRIFQITKSSNDWNRAEHLFDYGKVTKSLSGR